MAWGGTWRRYTGRPPEEIHRLLSEYAGKPLSAVPPDFRGVTRKDELEAYQKWLEGRKPMPAGWLTVDQISAKLEKTKNRKRV